MSTVYLRFYEELNDYLPKEKHKIWFEYSFSEPTSIIDVFHLMKIPPEEVDLILVNQQSEGLDYLLQNGDRISVYPVFELFNLKGVSKLREQPLRNPKFICDVHLGRLAKYLRMLGWDTGYSNQYTPDNMIAISQKENRIIITRNYELTRNKKVTHAYWIKSPEPLDQIKDVIDKFDLSDQSAPLTRCLNCNHLLEPIEKQKIINRLQDRTAKYFNAFFICNSCDQIYWKGSHFENMFDYIRHSIQNK